MVPATFLSCKQSSKACQHLVQSTSLTTLHISCTVCHLLPASISWVPSTSPDRSNHSHPCRVVLPASVLKTHFHCCCLKMKMPLRTASSVQPHPEAATITQAKHTLTRVEQDDGLKAHKFLPLKVHHAKPSSSSQQHVKDFHHALYTLPLIPVGIPSMGRHSVLLWWYQEFFIPLGQHPPIWFHQLRSKYVTSYSVYIWYMCDYKSFKCSK